MRLMFFKNIVREGLSRRPVMGSSSERISQLLIELEGELHEKRVRLVQLQAEIAEDEQNITRLKGPLPEVSESEEDFEEEFEVEETMSSYTTTKIVRRNRKQQPQRLINDLDLLAWLLPRGEATAYCQKDLAIALGLSTVNPFIEDLKALKLLDKYHEVGTKGYFWRIKPEKVEVVNLLIGREMRAKLLASFATQKEVKKVVDFLQPIIQKAK